MKTVITLWKDSKKKCKKKIKTKTQEEKKTIFSIQVPHQLSNHVYDISKFKLSLFVYQIFSLSYH